MRQAAWIAAGGVQVCNRRGWRSRPAARAFAPLFTMGGADGAGHASRGDSACGERSRAWCTRGVTSYET